MIRISGVPFQRSDLWTAGSVEKMIVQRMIEDTVMYSYQSLEELRFELEFRKNIIVSARAMNESGVPFEVFANARSNPEYWHLTNTGGFLLRHGVKPSVAIQDIFLNSSLYAFECATAMVIIFYHAALNTMGESLFNQIFQNDIYLYSWEYDSELQINTLYTFHSLPGDVVYFKNPDFDPKTPQWRGENAVVLGDGTFFGHGLGIVTAEKLIQDLNERRSSGSNQTAYLTDVIARPSFNHLANLSRSQQMVAVHKPQYVINHNESSIPIDRYA